MRGEEAVKPKRIGDYHVLGTIGAGGMGVVYLCAHQRTEERVALKTVHVEGEERVLAIRREISALRSIAHPGVVRVVDDGRHEGLPYYAMEVLEGRTLRSMTGCVGDREPDPNAWSALLPVLGVIRSVLTTLAFVHGKGIVHRDLKPENVIVVEGRGPVVLDFGIASRWAGTRGLETLDSEGHVLGSPSYMAPEQISGEIVDARTDLYAIGCILFECATGHLPFESLSARQVMSDKLHGAAPRAKSQAPWLPEALDELIARLLSPRPRERIGHAEDVANILETLGAPRLGEVGPTPEPFIYSAELVGRDDVVDRVLGALGGATRVGVFDGIIDAPDASDEGMPANDDTRADSPNESIARTKVSAPPAATAMPATNTSQITMAASSGTPVEIRRRGDVLYLGGPSGIGKTRVAKEATKLAVHRGFRVVTGQAVRVAMPGADAARAIPPPPLHPLRGLLVALGDALRIAALNVDARLAEHARVLAPFAPMLLEVPQVRALPSPAALPTDAARVRIHEALGHALSTLAASEPLLLVLDDLQWADELTLGFLESLGEGYFEKNAVVLVATYRSDEAGPELMRVIEQARGKSVVLGRLEAPSVVRLVEDALATRHADPDLTNYLLEQGEGNPFFISEYLRTAIDEGVLRRDGRGGWLYDSSPDNLTAMRLPRGLAEVVARRIGRLTKGALHVAEVLAVLGREAPPSMLRAALAPVDAESAIGELVATHVLEETASGHFRFVHDKLREATYDGLAVTRRRALHRNAARVIAGRTTDEERGATSGVLAHHLLQAGEEAEAITHLASAAEHALRTGSSVDAIASLRRAIPIAEARALPAATRFELYAKACVAEINLGNLVEGEAFGRKALEVLGVESAALLQPGKRAVMSFTKGVVAEVGKQLALLLLPRTSPLIHPRETTRHCVEVCEALGNAYVFMNDPTRAAISGVLAGNFAAPLEGTPELGRASAQLGVAASFIPAPSLTRRYFERAHRVATDDARTQSFISKNEGFVTMGFGDLNRAETLLAQARDFAETARDRRGEEEAVALLGMVHAFRGSFKQSLEAWNELELLSRVSRSTQGKHWMLGGKALCEARAGDASRAIALFTSLHGRIERLADRAGHLQLADMGPLYASQGDFDHALANVERILPIIEGPPAGSHVVQAYASVSDTIVRAFVAQARPTAELDALLVRATKAFAGFARIFPLGRPGNLFYQGELFRMRGHTRRAERRYLESIALANSFGMKFDEAFAIHGLACVSSADDRTKHRDRANAILASCGAADHVATSARFA